VDQLTPVVAAPPNGRAERHTAAADSEPVSLELFVTGILGDLVKDGPDDDIAILGVQWRN
jgi:hypothetical protein